MAYVSSRRMCRQANSKMLRPATVTQHNEREKRQARLGLLGYWTFEPQLCGGVRCWHLRTRLDCTTTAQHGSQTKNSCSKKQFFVGLFQLKEGRCPTGKIKNYETVTLVTFVERTCSLAFCKFRSTSCNKTNKALHYS